jgi:DNA modification methylase
MPSESVDAIVTDPPYELGFMGKGWDASGVAYDVNLWRECLRVLKPGGHLLAFGGTRTYHRMACAIEDAGFEIRDSIYWLYSSGFPKSHNVSKGIDRKRNDTLEIRNVCRWLRNRIDESNENVRTIAQHFGFHSRMVEHWAARDTDSQPTIPKWEQWQQLQSFLNFNNEMDHEVWRLNGRKGSPGENWEKREIIGEREVPLGHAFAGPTYGGDSSLKTVNVTAPATDAAKQWQGWGIALKPAHEPIALARKPLTGTVAANVQQYGTGALNIDASRIPMGDEYDPTKIQRQQNSTGAIEGAFGAASLIGKEIPTYNAAGRWPANVITDGTTEAEWVRYFFCPKASKAERNAGLDELNTHPTVKPLALMRYLVRLVTPPGGTVLEPFAGSGTTLAAAVLEGFNAIGCELTEDYLPIIAGRVQWAQQERANKTESLFPE